MNPLNENCKNQPLKIGFIGGGINSAVGYSHFCASRLDGLFQLECGCFSREQSINKETALMYGVEKSRVYDSFKDLMAEHFKNKTYANFWVDNIYKSLDVRKTFYKNHIAKIMKELGHIKIYSPKEYKAYQRQIKARKLSGIGSLKRSVKRVRKA